MRGMSMPPSIRITDVGPRDGLQNESVPVSTEAKVAFINQLQRSGVAEVEVTGFVHPEWVPQLADAVEVCERIERVPGVVRSALVPNEAGWIRAQAADVDKVAVFTAASDTFTRKNINCTIAESLERFAPVVRAASDAGKSVRGYISCAVACPYEGPVDPAAVCEVVRQLLDLGVDEIDLGDTIGVATPSDIERLLVACAPHLAPSELTLHLHDTGQGALACALHAMRLGVRSFDTSCGGLGGCPYAPGASGNLATEDLVGCCDMLGVDTSVTLSTVREASSIIEAVLGRPPRSRTGEAWSAAHP
jgi:hydroxymethylglutaryl-CoA lyase